MLGTHEHEEPAALDRRAAADAPGVGRLLDLTTALLKAVGSSLTVRGIVPRTSDIVGRWLAHERLDVTARDRDGRLRWRSRSDSEDSSDVWPFATRDHRCVTEDVLLIQDIDAIDSDDRERVSLHALTTVASAGYRSVLFVRTLTIDSIIETCLLAKSRAFVASDVPIAVCVANCLSVGVAHERLVDGQSVHVEEKTRAAGTDERSRSSPLRVGSPFDATRPIGESAGWRHVLKQVAQVATTDATVFVQGESGTGKEVVARLVHRASLRRNGPFVAVNCAALPEQLLESELFGYERGAFTGAIQAKPGQIEIAAGGVLFLDEVSEMSPLAQAKLLRFLQEREFQRLGGTRLVKADVRVIAASNRDLHGAVAQGQFREDLYYRLQVFDIHIPPLRERREDIVLLATAFLEEFGRTSGLVAPCLTQDAIDLLSHYDWPGNVRQLRNALERAAIVADGDAITRGHFALRPKPSSLSAPADLPALERRQIERILYETDGNKSQAARRLGVTRTQLYGRLRKYGLDHSSEHGQL